MLLKWRENRIIKAICKFQDGAFYPLVLGLITVLVHILRLEIYGFAVFAVCLCFTNLFSADTRSALPPLFLLSLVMAPQPTALDVGIRYFSLQVIIPIAVFIFLIVLAALVRLYVEKKAGEMFKKSPLIIGFAVLAASLLLGGLFSEHDVKVSLLLAVSLVFTGLIIYMFFSATLTHRDDSIKYLAKTAAVAAGVIVLELISCYVTKYQPGMPLDSAWKDKIILGWGVSNSVGELMIFLLPPIFYLAFTEKHGWLYYELVVVVMIAVYFTLSRNALLFGVPLFILGTVVCTIKGKNRLGVSISAGVVLIVVTVLLILQFRTDKVDNLFVFFTDAMLRDRGRFGLWKRYIGWFKEYPLFGKGFEFFNASTNTSLLAHNTVFQMMGSCGIVGLAACLYHRYETVRLYVVKPTLARTFMGVSVLAFVLMGLFDPIFFFAHFLIYYTVVLCVSEKEALFTVNLSKNIKKE